MTVLTASEKQWIKKTAWKVFTKVNGITLHSEATEYLLSHAVTTDDMEPFFSSLAAICHHDDITVLDRPTMEKLCHQSLSDVDYDGSDRLASQGVSSSSYIEILNAFQIPKFSWDSYKKKIVCSTETSTVFDCPEDRFRLFSDRYLLLRSHIQQYMEETVHPNFSFVPSIAALTGHDSDAPVSLIGLLSISKDGHLVLEDLESSVRLQFNEDSKVEEGVFTQGSIAMISGVHLQHAFAVHSVKLPFPENHVNARKSLSNIDMWKKAQRIHLNVAAEKMTTLEEGALSSMMVVLSDIWLDHPLVLSKLDKLFSVFDQGDMIPSVFVLMGRFSKVPFSLHPDAIQSYSNGFAQLSDMIVKYKNIHQQAKFLFIAGKDDPISTGLFPQAALPPFLVKKMMHQVPNAYFISNPCRIRHSFQTDMIFFRDNLTAKYSHHSLFSAPPLDVFQDQILKSIVRQGHLNPFHSSIQPIATAADAAMRLVPPPNLIFLADTCDRFNVEIEGITLMNPGSFSENEGSFIVYYPESKKCEFSNVQ